MSRRVERPHSPAHDQTVVYGVNAVLEAIRRGQVTRVLAGPRDDARIDEVLGRARAAQIDVARVAADELDALAGGGSHQGIAAFVRAASSYTIGDLIARAGGTPPLLVVLDGVEDPQNVGAIVRSADAAGAHGVVRQARHAAPLGGAAAKASAGAVSHVAVATVVNIARAIEELKGAGVWTVGLAGDGPARYDQVDYTVPTAFVVGAEGTGLRRLVRERCDWIVSIPMAGQMSSLNVSVATAIVLFEAVRQRRENRL